MGTGCGTSGGTIIGACCGTSGGIAMGTGCGTIGGATIGTGCGVGGTNWGVSGGATTLTTPETGTGVPGGMSGLREGGVGG